MSNSMKNSNIGKHMVIRFMCKFVDISPKYSERRATDIPTTQMIVQPLKSILRMSSLILFLRQSKFARLHMLIQLTAEAESQLQRPNISSRDLILAREAGFWLKRLDFGSIGRILAPQAGSWLHRPDLGSIGQIMAPETKSWLERPNFCSRS